MAKAARYSERAVKAAPTFVVPLKEKFTCEPGQVFRIDIWLAGNPSPNVTWLRDGVPLVDNDRVLAASEVGLGLFVLLFRTFKAEDCGNYTCKAANEAGETVSSGNLELAVDK